MADTLTWNGSTSGDVNVAANWTPAQVPIDGDSIIVDGAATQDMDASLGTFAAMKFPLFFIGPDATISIGTAASSGNALKFAATKIVNQGTGTFYYQFAASGVNSTDEIIVNSPNRELAMSMLGGSGVTCAVLTLTSGRMVVTDTLIVVDFVSSFRTSFDTDVIASFGTTSISNFYMRGGLIDIGILGRRTHCMGGTLTITGTGSSEPPEIFVNGGTVINKNTSTVSLVELRSGTLDLVQLSRELTITLLRRWPNTTLKTNELVTITTTEDMSGGDI